MAKVLTSFGIVTPNRTEADERGIPAASPFDRTLLTAAAAFGRRWLSSPLGEKGIHKLLI
jgi:hypothetical protein